VFGEANFRFSDEKAELVRILNNGNVRGMPILLMIMNRQKEFNPQAFQVFGPGPAPCGFYRRTGMFPG
jgi:hypothetical protein